MFKPWVRAIVLLVLSLKIYLLLFFFFILFTCLLSCLSHCLVLVGLSLLGFITFFEDLGELALHFLVE